MNVEFECVHCQGLNEINLEDINLSELVDSNIETEETRALKEKIKLQEIQMKRQEDDLIKAQSGIKKAISKTDNPSMELQGEVAEEILIEDLEDIFEDDKFRPIKKGEKGGDILHSIISPSGHQAGSILYESKNTKTYLPKWKDKLKKDMEASQATIGLLVSKSFPKGKKDILVQLDDRVWLTKPGTHVPAMVRVIRNGILMGHRTMVLDEFSSKTDKDILYEYITGDFVEQIKIILNIYTQLSDQISSEKRSFEKQWKVREKSLDRLMGSITGIAGSIEASGVPSLTLDKVKEISFD
jgi:hypothetical protein